MYSIAPIGSCRINTPLMLMSDAFGYRIVRTRNYGYSHSSSEALQSLAFMQGRFTPSAEAWPLMARGRDRAEFESAAPAEADMYIVEISSAKKLTFEGNCIQINYLTSEYASFFRSNVRREQYWRIIKDGTQEEIDAYLRENWSESPEAQQDWEVLRRIRLSVMTDDEIRADVRELMALLPDVLFVTHVNARKTDGSRLITRDYLIEAVNRIVREEGGLVYDPTPRMEEVGQENAIEDYSDSLAHFTEPFAEILFEDWFEMAIGPVFDRLALNGGPDTVRSKALPHFSAMVESGRTLRLADRIDTFAEAGLASAELLELQARVSALHGADDRTLATLEDALARFPDHSGLLARYAETAQRIGNDEKVSWAYDRLIATGSPPRPQAMLALVDALIRGAKVAQARHVLEQLLAIEPKHQVGAMRLAGLIAQSGASIEELRRETVIALEQTLPPSERYRLGLLNIDFTREADSLVKGLPVDEILDLVESLAAGGRRADAADLAAALQLHGEKRGDTEVRLRRIAARWFAEGAEASGLGERFALIRDVRKAYPLMREARLDLRSLRMDLQGRIKDCYKNDDLGGLDAIKAELEPLGERFFELDYYRARLLYAKADFAAALDAALAAREQADDNILVHLFIMRSATSTGDLLIAREAAERVCELADADTERLEREALLLLARLPRHAFLEAGKIDDPHRAAEYFKLALSSPELEPRASAQLARIERRLASEVANLEKAGDPLTVAYSERTLVLFPGHRRALLALARSHSRMGQFAEALPFWERLVALEPDNDDYQMQRERAKGRREKEREAEGSGA